MAKMLVRYCFCFFTLPAILEFHVSYMYSYNGVKAKLEIAKSTQGSCKELCYSEVLCA